MDNTWIIARREYKRFFISPIAYILMVVILLTLGGFLFLDILFAAQTQQFVPNLQRTFQLFVFPLLFLSAPAITMRSIAEENRQGTLELLLTAPVTDGQLIVGKWLGSFLFFLTIIATTIIYPLILNGMVSPGIDMGLALTGYLGVILMTAALTAIGVCTSSFYSHQLAAFFTSLGVIILLWVIGTPAQLMEGAAADIIRYLSITEHFYNNFLVGIIKLDSILYYLSVTALSLFLGSVSVEMRRWR